MWDGSSICQYQDHQKLQEKQGIQPVDCGRSSGRGRYEVKDEQYFSFGVEGQPREIIQFSNKQIFIASWTHQK